MGLVAEVGSVLDGLPPDARAFELQLLNYSFTEDCGLDAPWLDFFSRLRSCHTISFRHCTCSHPAALLQVYRAVRSCLESLAPSWVRLFVIPANTGCVEELPELRLELPLLIDALRRSSVVHFSRSGARTCSTPVAPIPKEARFLAGVLVTCLDCKRVAGSIVRQRQEQKAGARSDGVPAMFLHGVLYIWRFFLSTQKLLTPGEVEDGLDPAAADYVEGWLRNMAPCWEGSWRRRLNLTDEDHEAYGRWNVLAAEPALGS